MCVMSTPPRTPALVLIPYRPPARAFPSGPVTLAPVGTPAPSSTSSAPEAPSREVAPPVHASRGDGAPVEPVAPSGASLEHHEESPPSGIEPPKLRPRFRRVAAVLSMWAVGCVVARCGLGGTSPIGWTWLLLIGLVSALVPCLSRTRKAWIPRGPWHRHLDRG